MARLFVKRLVKGELDSRLKKPLRRRRRIKNALKKQATQQNEAKNASRPPENLSRRTSDASHPAQPTAATLTNAFSKSFFQEPSQWLSRSRGDARRQRSRGQATPCSTRAEKTAPHLALSTLPGARFCCTLDRASKRPIDARRDVRQSHHSTYVGDVRQKRF